MMRALEMRESVFFFSSRRRHTRCSRDWSSDVCSSDLADGFANANLASALRDGHQHNVHHADAADKKSDGDRKSTRLNSSHGYISYAVFCLKKKKKKREQKASCHSACTAACSPSRTHRLGT